MRLAVLGTRGIPAAYGGFETLAEELSTRLARRGHDVTVYARRGRVREEVERHEGVRVVFLPTVNHKYLETVVHGLLSGLHAASEGYDALLFCNAINALACRLPKLLGASTRVLLNVDGLERKRRKWNAAGKLAYSLSERLSCVLADVVVTDAHAIRRYYEGRYRIRAAFAAYGSDLAAPTDPSPLAGLGLTPGGYVLYVSRFEPENNPDAVVRAYRDVPGSLPLVLLGSAPYASELIGRLRAEAALDPRVVLPGALYGDAYRTLLASARAYVHATEVGGTHPALVEAMGFGRPVLVHDTEENREAAGDAALYFRVEEPATLTGLLARTLGDDALLADLGRRARARAESLYLWEEVTTVYEGLLAGTSPDYHRAVRGC